MCAEKQKDDTNICTIYTNNQLGEKNFYACVYSVLYSREKQNINCSSLLRYRIINDI